MRRSRCDHSCHAGFSARVCLGALAAGILLARAVPAEAQTPFPAGVLAPIRAVPADAAAQDREPAPDAGHRQGKPGDLSQLTLEQLLEVEITPINVLGSHTHLKGQWMFGYRYMRMNMNGNREGTRNVSIEEVLRRYSVAHPRMTMEMHMLEAMHAPSDMLTLMVMVPYKHNSMDHINRAGVRFSTRSEGIGDVALMALHTVRGHATGGGERLIVNTGLSIPTGSIDERDDTPTRRSARLEYMMQLGSGTFDLLPGVTYLGEAENWAWGAQALGTLRLGRNDEGYRFGHEYRVNAWGVYKLRDWVAPSLRLEWLRWGNVHGRDPELDPAANPAFDPNKQKGRRLDLLVGLHLYAPRGGLKGHRLALEGGWPIYQSIAGPNTETDWQWSVAWSYTFIP